MAFIEKKYGTSGTNWWFPNEACVVGMLRSAGFRSITPAGDRCYICDAATPPARRLLLLGLALPDLPTSNARLERGDSSLTWVRARDIPGRPRTV
jgi:hypothetical protein